MTSEQIDALWDYADPAASESRFRDALNQTNGESRAEIQTQIARAQGLQRNFGAAHATLDALEPNLPDYTPAVRTRYYLERGRVLNSSGDAEAAVPVFVQAWKSARGAGDDFYAVDAAHMLAIAEPPEKQLRWYHRGMELAEESDDPRARKWLGALYNNAGWSYCETNHYKDALPLFEKALAWRKEQGQDRETRVAEWTVARCLRSLLRVEEAFAIQQRLLAAWDAAGEPDAYVFEEMGECLLALGRDAEAPPYFGEAYALLSQDPWFVEKEADRLARMKAMMARA